MMRISVVLTMSNTRGLMNCSRWANSAPATPAQKAESMNASTFTRRVLTLIRSLAISSSRMASTPRP